MEISNFLRTVPLFTKLEDAELQRFAELTREKSYPKGSVILFEDDPGDSLFIVRDTVSRLAPIMCAIVWCVSGFSILSPLSSDAKSSSRRAIRPGTSSNASP